MVGRARTFLGLLESTLPTLLEALSPVARGEEPSEVDASPESADFSRQVLAECTDQLLMFQLMGAGWIDFGKPERVLTTPAAAGIPLHLAAAGRDGTSIPGPR